MMVAQFALLALTPPGIVFNIGAVEAIDWQFDPSSASALIIFNIDGTITGFGNQSLTTQDWIAPKTGTVGNDYDIYIHKTSGTTPTSGTMDTWVNLGTSPQWYLQRSGIGSRSCHCTVQIRRVSDSVVVATGALYLEALVDV
jgi:hypothetical protein